MTTTMSAAETGLPLAPSIFEPLPRRGFLAGLAKLPLIGGSVALLGRPTAVAEAATPEMIEAYKTWLALELRFLAWEMADDPYFTTRYRVQGEQNRSTRSKEIGRHEWYVGDSAKDHSAPYKRAALVMSAVGCDWRDREGIFNFDLRGS